MQVDLPGWAGAALPPADQTVFCCPHVELEYFEVHFLSLQNNGVFDISDHSTSTLEIRNHTGPFVWISLGEEKQHSFVCFYLFPAYEMTYFCLSRKVRGSYLMTSADLPG